MAVGGLRQYQTNHPAEEIGPHGRSLRVAPCPPRGPPACGLAKPVPRLMLGLRALCQIKAHRPPKMAVPTRTIVLPEWIAASRSAVIPIDKVSMGAGSTP